MKFAAVRAATWFFGSMLALLALNSFGMMGEEIESMSAEDVFIGFAILAALVAAFVFFLTWHQELERTRQGSEEQQPE